MALKEKLRTDRPDVKLMIIYNDESVWTPPGPNRLVSVVNEGTPLYYQNGWDLVATAFPANNTTDPVLQHIINAAGGRPNDAVRNSMKKDLGYTSSRNCDRLAEDLHLVTPALHSLTRQHGTPYFQWGTEVMQKLEHPFSLTLDNYLDNYPAHAGESGPLFRKTHQLVKQKLSALLPGVPDNNVAAVTVIHKDLRQFLKWHCDQHNGLHPMLSGICGYSAPSSSSVFGTRHYVQCILYTREFLWRSCQNIVTLRPIAETLMQRWRFMDPPLRVVRPNDLARYISDAERIGYCVTWNKTLKVVECCVLFTYASANKMATYESVFAHLVTELVRIFHLSLNQTLEVIYMLGTCTQPMNLLLVLQHWVQTGIPSGEPTLFHAIFKELGKRITPNGGTYVRSQVSTHRPIKLWMLAKGLQAIRKHVEEANERAASVATMNKADLRAFYKEYCDKFRRDCITFGPLKVQSLLKVLVLMRIMDTPCVLDMAIMADGNSFLKEGNNLQLLKSGSIRDSFISAMVMNTDSTDQVVEGFACETSEGRKLVVDPVFAGIGYRIYDGE